VEAAQRAFPAELFKSPADVIIVAGDAAIRAAQQATTTTPILAFTDDMKPPNVGIKIRPVRLREVGGHR